MNFENPSLRETLVCARERLQNHCSAITDFAIGSVFEDSNDIEKALTEAFEE